MNNLIIDSVFKSKSYLLSSNIDSTIKKSISSSVLSYSCNRYFFTNGNRSLLFNFKWIFFSSNIITITLTIYFSSSEVSLSTSDITGVFTGFTKSATNFKAPSNFRSFSGYSSPTVNCKWNIMRKLFIENQLLKIWKIF